jgi:Flp pilus assembly pilin Flp
MRVSLGQILILLLISFLLFGDLKTIKKNITNVFKKLNAFFNKKNRKKGS